MVFTIQGIDRARLRIAALLRAEHGRLLLRLADNEHPLPPFRRQAIRQHEVLFAFPFAKRHQRHALPLGESLHISDEGIADRLHQRRRRKRRPAMKPKEVRHASIILQPRLIDVEIHPVDALHLQRHMLVEDIGRRSW